MRRSGVVAKVLEEKIAQGVVDELVQGHAFIFGNGIAQFRQLRSQEARTGRHESAGIGIWEAHIARFSAQEFVDA